MTYTQLSVTFSVVAVLVDLYVLRTSLVRRRLFWGSYVIVLFFQFISNGVLTGANIVKYNGAAIVGSTSPSSGHPPFVGDGRIAFAPIEDIGFGFALVLLTLCLWVWWGRRGLQRTPRSGPPRSLVRRLFG